MRMAEGGAVDTAPGVSAAYRRAMQVGGQQTVDDYYANLRADAKAYLANPNAPTGAEAYNVLLQSGISTSDLINAGVDQAVLDKIFAVKMPIIPQSQFVTPTGMTSAYERSPDLAFESQRLTAQGQDGRAILDKQGRDYIANLQQGGIDAAERAQMLEYATERGYSFDDLMKAGVDPNVLFTRPQAAPPPPPFPDPVPYTPITVYQPLPTQPDIFAAGQPALDTTFRESSPRTAIPGMPGQFDYSPAAKLRPATGAGFTFTPPSVTSRPRSLLSPREIQAYGGLTSASQRFAQNRQLLDNNLRRLAQSTPALKDLKTYNQLRNMMMSSYFAADPNTLSDPLLAFDPKTVEGQNLQKYLAGLPAPSTQKPDPIVVTDGMTGKDVEIDAPVYGGFLPFAKGGYVKKSDGSARDGLARFQEGGEVSGRRPLSPNDPLYIRQDAPVNLDELRRRQLGDVAPAADAQLPLDELLRRQLEGIDNTPSTARTAGSQQSESRNMLQNIVAGAKQIPGTVFDYGRGIAQSENPLAQIRSDVGAMGGAMIEGAKQDPLGFALDMTPIIGEIRSGMDAKKYSDMANEADRAGDYELADSYRQVSTMAAAGAVPFGGIGARGARRAAMSDMADVPPDSARGMLDALTPEAGVDAPRTPGEDVDALTALDQPPAGSAAAMLDEVDAAAPSARLSRDELGRINASVGSNRIKQRAMKEETRRIKNNFLPDDGWERINFSGVKENKPDFKKIAYGFQKPPEGLDKGEWANRLSDNLVSEVDGVVQRARSGDQAAIDILRQANWYRGMRDQLRSEFGGIGDVFADVLGTTSAQTNVEQNFRNATEILRRYSRGEFDTELQAYENRIKQGIPVDGKTLTALHKAGEFPLITNSAGKLFNTNSPSSMGALLDMFRSVKTGSAPKTPNFTGNLIGLTNEATVDVWAARMLRRLSGQSRIPPVAEQGVTGTHLVGSSLGNPRVGGEFGFGQDVFRSAANRINESGNVKSVVPEMGDLGPDDLQAVAWFMEKERWTNNGWTTKAGEGGSLEYEMSLAGSPDQVRIDDLRREINTGFKTPNKRKKETDAEYAERVAQARRVYDNRQELAGIELQSLQAPLQRYTVGVSGERPDLPMSNYAQAELAAEIDDVVRNDSSVLGYNLANTYGSFMGNTERALNAEFVVQQNFNPSALIRRLVEQGKNYNQDAVFISRSVPAGSPNARPGAEIFFKEEISPKELAKITARLREYGVDGFTYITDMRFDDRINRQARSGAPETAKLTGLRFQYIPEFDEGFDPRRADEIYKEKEDLFAAILADTMADQNVSDIRYNFYDTQVFFRDGYDEYLTRNTPASGSQAGGEVSSGAGSAQSNRGREGQAELPEPVRDRSGQAARASPQEGIDNFAKGGAVTSSRRMLENLIGKKPEGQRVDATGLLGFANGGEARVGGSAPAVAGRTGRAAQLAAQRAEEPQTESRAMLERLDAATPVERAVFESTGMEPGLDRAMMLPFAGSREEGNLQLAAPGFVYDAARAFVTPGMAARGQRVSDEDILNTAMNVMGGGVGASRVAGPRTAPDEMLLGMGVGSNVIKLGNTGGSNARNAADELKEIFAENPLNSRELISNTAGATVYSMGDTLHLSDIRTFDPGKGGASKMLRSILEVADKNNVPVTLTADNYSGDGLTTAQLVDWYKRNGFEVENDFGDDGVDMIRQPRNITEEASGAARSTPTAADDLAALTDRAPTTSSIAARSANVVTALNKSGDPLGINVAVDPRNGTDYADLIVSGAKKFESRETASLKPYVGKRVGIVRTGAGQAEVIGSVEIGQPIKVNEKQFNQLRDQHLVAEDSSFNIKKGQTKFLYPMIDPTSTPPQKVTSKGIVARAIPTGQRAADDLAALTDRAPKLIDSLPGRNELNYWIDGGQDAVERGFPEEPFILLDKLYIDPQNRGQGAARQVLVEGLQEMAEQYPGMDVRLLAEPLDRSTNQSDLVRLYESVGFEVDNYQDGMSSIPMSLRLPKKVARTGGNTPPAALGYAKGGAVTKNNVERMRNDNRKYL
jgi:predicted GNAT family N-acyltransferase